MATIYDKGQGMGEEKDYESIRNERFEKNRKEKVNVILSELDTNFAFVDLNLGTITTFVQQIAKGG